MALCSHCGKEVDNGIKFCTSCGKEIDNITNEEQNPYAPPEHSAVRTDVAVLSNYDLRACSRQQLKGAWGKMALAIFVYSLITIFSQFIFSEYGFYIPVLDIIITIAVLVTAGPFALGLTGYFLKRIRGQEIFVKNIFDGFKRFLPSLALAFFTTLFVFLWSFLLIVPGIIKSFSYSMAFYIMYDNPDMKPLDAIRKSQLMMKGYKGKLFMLYLSFFGWCLLAVLTLGIGYFWITPYMCLAVGNFYENLKQAQEKSTEI